MYVSSLNKNLSDTKPRSLVEQKKLQWAKEREELAKLSTPWGKHVDSLDKNVTRRSSHPRSPSESTYESFKNLPPITPKILQKPEKYQNYDRYELEGGDNTSGYASESNKDSSPDHDREVKDREIQVWQNNSNNWRQSELDSQNSQIMRLDERAKWGDRGLAVGHLWDPRDIGEPGKPVEPPNWLQRGLKRDKEILVVSQSPEQSDLERPFTSDSNLTNNTSRTHLRGQNIPLDPNEIVERERKRKQALELQEAIKRQLEEKELRRKAEREKKLREEAEEEDRIRKEQELERKRVEEEEKIIQEKKDREKQRAKQMQLALEEAEKNAKASKKSNRKFSIGKSKMEEKVVSEEINAVPPIPPPKLQHSPIHRPIITQPTGSLKSPKTSPISTPKRSKTPQKSPKNSPKSPKVETPKKYSQEIPKIKTSGSSENLENFALVLPNTFENFQNMQFALLVPNLPISGDPGQNLPIALSDRNYFTTENRVLTPSIYRNKKILRESSTQTDMDEISGQIYPREDTGSLDRNRSKNRDKRELKRYRSEDRSAKENRERPKWGANRPPTRYLKQSEKDPFYQKRKLRQKTREIQLIYEDKNNNYSESSDCSPPLTPEHIGHKSGYKNRSKWHKNERMFAQNISVYQTEIMPLEFDRQGRVYLKEQDFESEKERKYRQNSRYRPDTRYKNSEIYRSVDRLTPKYDSYDRNDHRKMTVALTDDSDIDRSENEQVLEKLNALQKGLMIKKRQWENHAHSNTTFPNV